MNDEEEDSAEMLDAKRTARKGLVLVLIGATIVLALALVTVYDTTRYTADHSMEWWIVAGIGSLITFTGMGISIAGEQRQQAILNREISELLKELIEKR